jgi:Transcriptional regulators
MREALADGRREHVLIANQRFHDIVYGAAGNMALARVAGQLRDFMRRFSTLPFASPDRVEHVWQEHEAILEALENHDPDAASAASIAHLEAAREYLIRLDLKEFAATGLR